MDESGETEAVNLITRQKDSYLQYRDVKKRSTSGRGDSLPLQLGGNQQFLREPRSTRYGLSKSIIKLLSVPRAMLIRRPVGAVPQ